MLAIAAVIAALLLTDSATAARPLHTSNDSLSNLGVVDTLTAQTLEAATPLGTASPEMNVVLLNSGGSGGGSVSPAKAPPAPSGRIGPVVSYAKSQPGKRYVFGTAGPNTFDCSGLVVAAYKRIGINLPHSTYSLINRGWAVSKASMKPGDLIFPTGSGHVGIYIGGGLMVHASNPRTGVKISTVYGTWRIRRIV